MDREKCTKNRVINPNFDVTPKPEAVAQLTPTPELIASLAAAEKAPHAERTLSDIDLEKMEAEELEELAAACKSRANMYALLSRVYRVEADQSLLDQLKSANYAANTGNKDVDEGYRLLVKWLGQTWEHSLLDLAKDYVRAFIGYTGDHASAAYPFESVYRSEKHLLMQESRDEVLACYRAAGLEKNESWREGEDHVALEFEYMSTMATRTADALRSADTKLAQSLLNDQSHFLQDHLIAWVPNFTQDVERCSTTKFYRGFALVTRSYLECEMELFGDLAEQEETAA